MLEAVPRLRLGYRDELSGMFGISRTTITPIYIYVAQFDCDGVNGEICRNMEDVKWSNHLRHFHVGHLAHADSWNTHGL